MNTATMGTRKTLLSSLIATSLLIISTNALAEAEEQDRVGAASDSAVERDPSGVAAHHLENHDPLV